MNMSKRRERGKGLAYMDRERKKRRKRGRRRGKEAKEGLTEAMKGSGSST